MGLLESYTADNEKLKSGHKVEFYNDAGDIVGWITVGYAGASNRHFNNYRASFMKPYERKIAQGSMSETESDKLLQEVFVRGGIVLAWGEDEPLTVENFQNVMEQRPEIWRDIVNVAYNMKLFAVRSDVETGN
ncbi:MAG: hypothetical protein FWD70_03860 [Desulfuromonadales bacterium]|nr:hypothetical protein [Desulfuromonadales bacterium]